MNKILASLVGAVAVLSATALLLVGGTSKAADITFIGRGIVKPGGDKNSINVYWTQVPATVERIRGVRSDVSTSSATKYVWSVNKNGKLLKLKVAGLPKPEQEVVLRGTLHSDDRVTASWVVTNYRKFKVTGKLQGVTMDTGKGNAGWARVNVSTSILRDVIPSRKFKEATVKGKDIRFRVNGSTSVVSLGKTKQLEEVSSSQQTVIIEGEVQDEDTWVATKFTEVN